MHAISTLKIQSSVLTQSCTEVRGRHPFTLGTLDLVSEIKNLTLGSFMFITEQAFGFSTKQPFHRCFTPQLLHGQGIFHLRCRLTGETRLAGDGLGPGGCGDAGSVGCISSSKRLICGLTANHHTIAGNDVWCHLRSVPAPCLMHPGSPECQRLVLVLESWTWKIYENLKD